MTNNLSSDIEGNQVILILMSKENCPKMHTDLVKKVKKFSKGVCFTCFSHPFKSTLSAFSKENINTMDMMFIDVLTSTVKKPENAENCFFVDSPSDLTELNLTYSEIISSGKIDTSIFASISTLLIYQDALAVIQLVHSIINKSRLKNVKLIFTAAKEDKNTELIKDMHMFVDKVIEL